MQSNNNLEFERSNNKQFDLVEKEFQRKYLTLFYAGLHGAQIF